MNTIILAAFGVLAGSGLILLAVGSAARVAGLLLFAVAAVVAMINFIAAATAPELGDLILLVAGVILTIISALGLNKWLAGPAHDIQSSI